MPTAPSSQPDHKSQIYVAPSQARGTTHTDEDIKRPCLLLKRAWILDLYKCGPGSTTDRLCVFGRFNWTLYACFF